VAGQVKRSPLQGFIEKNKTTVKEKHPRQRQVIGLQSGDKESAARRSYEQGAVVSTEKNFMLLWLTMVPQFSPAEVRFSILSTLNIFESASGTFQAEIA